MAFLAVGRSHFRRVRLVALAALRDLAMGGVTGGAIHGTMFALMVPELSNLLGVAGCTGFGHIARNGHVQGCMRVVVTAETTLEFVMRLARVALTALGDLTVDGVTGGTIKRAVLALIGPEQFILLRVTCETNTFFR